MITCEIASTRVRDVNADLLKIIEIPALSQALTLNKGDFVRTGARGAVFLSYRRAVQEAVQAELTRWGDARDAAEDTRRKVARPMERDLERVRLLEESSFARPPRAKR